MSKVKQMIKTTRISTKGQVVIPEDIRKSLELESSDEMIVVLKGNRIIMRKLTLEDVLDEAELDKENGKTISHKKIRKRHGV